MSVQADIQKFANKEKAVLLSRYFKTGKGQYGEGAVFLGLTVPQQRAIAQKYKDLPLREIELLLKQNIHEYRLTALLILVKQFEKGSDEERKQIVNLYLHNTKYINNWDLVDLSAPKIVGTYLLHQKPKRKLLYTFAKSKNLWERRIAIMSTFPFIKQKDFSDTYAIAEDLLHDKHDLIHKTVGWCLREIGKVDQKKEEEFLKKHAKMMPRTMLRYAIEKFPIVQRARYLHK